MFEAIPIRTNEVDDEWADKFFADAFAIKPLPVTILGAPSQTPATKKYIRSSALPAQLAERVEQAYADILGDGEFVFVTIHQDLLNLRRKVRSTNPPTYRLGRRLIDLIEAATPLELAYEEILKEFFACLERELQCYVRSVRAYENEGKHHKDGAPVTHVHICIPLPKGRGYYRFIGEFSRLYARLIYPVDLPIDVAGRLVTDQRTLEDLKREPRTIQGTQNLNFMPGRLDGIPNHPEYSVKQIVNEAALRERLHISMRAAKMGGGRFQ
ncbi:MAG TPA: hypothetical protein PLZ79_06440 [Burkholderiales bacterium]|nr:hypothetical protein [Burkholderiales bacterium]